MRFLFTLALLAASLSAPAQRTATFDWKGPVAVGQTLEIRNVNGDIHALPAAGTDVEISVQSSGTYPHPETVKIDIVPGDTGILVCTIYSGLSYPDHCTPDRAPSVTLSNSDLRVKYEIRVPAGVNLIARTVNGRITADLPDSPISTETVNGRVVLSTGKPAQAHVVNGSILASLSAADWDGVREFLTVNGTVDVEIPATATATVRANTVWGSITTEFSIPAHRALVGTWLSGDVNGGGSKLVLTTVNGSIHLRRSE